MHPQVLSGILVCVFVEIMLAHCVYCFLMTTPVNDLALCATTEVCNPIPPGLESECIELSGQEVQQ